MGNMGNIGCLGCGGVPVPTPYPVATKIIPATATSNGSSPIYGGVVDADPITPGIQRNPGIVLPVGPSTVVGNIQREPLSRPGGYYANTVVRPY